MTSRFLRTRMHRAAEAMGVLAVLMRSEARTAELPGPERAALLNRADEAMAWSETVVKWAQPGGLTADQPPGGHPDQRSPGA